MEKRFCRTKSGMLSFGLLIALMFVASSIFFTLSPLSTAVSGFKLCSRYFRLALTVKSIYMSNFCEDTFNGFCIETSSRSVFKNRTEIEIIHYHITEGSLVFDFEKVGTITITS